MNITFNRNWLSAYFVLQGILPSVDLASEIGKLISDPLYVMKCDF